MSPLPQPAQNPQWLPSSLSMNAKVLCKNPHTPQDLVPVTSSLSTTLSPPFQPPLPPCSSRGRLGLKKHLRVLHLLFPLPAMLFLQKARGWLLHFLTSLSVRPLLIPYSKLQSPTTSTLPAFIFPHLISHHLTLRNTLIYLLINYFLLLLEHKLHEDRGFFLFCSLLCPQHI